MPDPRMNHAPPGFDPDRDLPSGFWAFYEPLHRVFTPRRQQLAAARMRALGKSVV